MMVLAEIQSQWSTLGTALNVPEEMLPVNQQSVPDNVKLKATLQAWIDTRSSPVTWKTVMEAVKSPIINNRRVGDEIRKYLCQDQIFHKYIEYQYFDFMYMALIFVSFVAINDQL